MKTAIVWLKTDLRLHDNEALIQAVAHNDQVVPVYCIDDRHYRKTELGFKKTGSFRAQFIWQALADMDAQLRSVGSGLIVVRGNPAQELPQLAVQYAAHAVYAADEVAHEELATQREVAEALRAVRCTLEVFAANALYNVDDLPFTVGHVPDIFTAFRHKVEAHCKVRAALPTPTGIPSPTLPPLQLPHLSALGLTVQEADSRTAFPYSGGENHALGRLHYYLEESRLVSNYKNTRNQLIGADYSTKFSPWLAIGCISPRYIYHALQTYEAQHGANESTYWVVFELLWRDFFRLMMAKYGSKLFMKGGISGRPPAGTVQNNDALNKWINGQTGADFVDANMRELQLTGFMSNRGRQNVASYLCNDLKLDWRFGAAYFEEQLIDYDVCSNWGNWAYIAGVGNDPRPNRYFNIAKQAQQYDADQQYRQLWLG